MAKRRPENQDPSQPSRPNKPPQRAGSDLPWHPFWRFLVSVLIAVHLLAVFVAPWDLSTEAALPPDYRPPNGPNGQPGQLPPLSSSVWQQPRVPRLLRRFFRHYLNLIYLNHGYQFFAPDPAGSHLINYTVTKPDGTTVEGTFPSLEDQWPRLFYHRHMMLAAQTEGMPNSGVQYANHLAKLHGGVCSLELVFHLLQSPQKIIDGAELDAPSTYRALGTVKSQPFAAESISPEAPVAIPGAGQ